MIVLNDIDNINGNLFEIHLDTFYSEIYQSEEYLIFKINHQDKVVSYIYL